MLWSVLGISLLFLAIISFGVTTGNTDQAGQGIIYELFNTVGAQIILPLMALIFAYMAIVGERESGSLRILFGLTHSRKDVLLGKLLSRSATMAVSMVVATGIVLGLLLLKFDSLDVSGFLMFFFLTQLLIVTFTGIGIGVSAIASTRIRAMGGAIGSYVVLFIVWNPLAAVLHYVANGELADITAPDWYLFFLNLNPLNAYRYMLGNHLNYYLGTFVGWPSIVEDISPQEVTNENVLLLTNRAGDVFYTADWFTVLVFLTWFAVPVAIGYWQFQRADLN
jgi:ABC-2 type transport system permease protein